MLAGVDDHRFTVCSKHHSAAAGRLAGAEATNPIRVCVNIDGLRALLREAIYEPGIAIVETTDPFQGHPCLGGWLRHEAAYLLGGELGIAPVG